MLTPSTPAENARGILAMLTAVTLFVANDALIKLASAVFPVGQMMAVRGLIAALLALAIVHVMGEGKRLRLLAQPLVGLRGLLEAVIAFLFITALAVIPLADATAILQATPLILTAILVAFGLERVGWRRFLAILTGFVGVVLILRPGGAGIEPAFLLALASAVLVAVRDLVTRMIRAEVPSIVIAFGTTVSVGLAGVLIGILGGEDWQGLGRFESLYLVAAAALVVSANIALVMAFRRADISVVSPFRYASVLLALAIGIAVFGDVPDVMAILGFVLVVGAGLYSVHRERVRRRAIAAAHAPAAGTGAAP